MCGAFVCVHTLEMVYSAWACVYVHGSNKFDSWSNLSIASYNLWTVIYVYVIVIVQRQIIFGAVCECVSIIKSKKEKEENNHKYMGDTRAFDTPCTLTTCVKGIPNIIVQHNKFE